MKVKENRENESLEFAALGLSNPGRQTLKEKVTDFTPIFVYTRTLLKTKKSTKVSNFSRNFRQTVSNKVMKKYDTK